MHHVFRGPERMYGAYTGRSLLASIGVPPEQADALFAEYKETVERHRVQAGTFLFFALSRVLSATEPAAPASAGDEAAVFRRVPEVVEALRCEQSLVALPDDMCGGMCTKCGVCAVVTLPARQMRSADEPETYVEQCAACGRRT